MGMLDGRITPHGPFGSVEAIADNPRSRRFRAWWERGKHVGRKIDLACSQRAAQSQFERFHL